MKDFNSLPNEVQEKVKKVLKAYDRVYVIFENGEYNVSVGIGIKKEYASDHEFIGEYKVDEIYTKEERIINYVESFHEYPIQYKGKRDYAWLNSLTSWDCKVKFDENGNLVSA